MTTRIAPAEVQPGMYVDHDGKRWQVWKTEPEPGAAGAVRLRLRRPWMPRTERTSAYWMPAESVVLDRDQGTCTACGLGLIPGLDEEAHHLRTAAGGRYFCAVSDDALHHPALLEAR